MPDLKLIAEFGANTKALEAGLKKVESKLKGLEGANKAAASSASALAAKTAQSAKALKQFAAIAAATALAVGIQSVKAFAKFDQGMREVGTLTKFTAKEMRSMSNETKKMAQTFGQNIGKLTKARYDIVSAGFSDIKDQTILLTQANKLAIAGVTDVSTATDALTSVLNAYGEGAEGAQQASDLLFSTVRAGKTTLPELSAALGKVLPTAVSAGVGFNEVSAALATMTAQGIKTPQAVTALNSALFAMGAPTSQAAKAMEDLGINMKDTQGNVLPLLEVVGQFEGLNLDQIQKLTGDRESAKAFSALVNDVLGLTENLDKMNESAGATEEGFKEMSEGAQFEFNKMSSAVDVLKITFGEFLTSAAGGPSIMSKFTGVLNDWSDLLTLNKDGVTKLGAEWLIFVGEISGVAPDKGVLLDTLNFYAELSVGARTAAEEIRQLKKDQGTLGKALTLNEQIGQGIIDIFQGSIFGNSQKDVVGLIGSMEELDEAVGKAGEKGVDLGKTMTGGIDQIVSSTASGTSDMTASFGDASGEITSVFGTTIDSLGNTVSAQAGSLFTPIPPEMSRAASQAKDNYDRMLRQLKTDITIQVNVQRTGGFAEGGFVTPIGFANGGLAPSDTVPAMLTPGEMVIKEPSVNSQTRAGLEFINNQGRMPGFALGGIVQGFQDGGTVERVGGATTALTGFSGIGALDTGDQSAQITEAAQARMEANQAFLDMQADFDQEMFELRLSGMNEQERIEAEFAEARKQLMLLPFSDEQKDLLLEQQQALQDEQLALIEVGAMAEAEKEMLEERLANILEFQQSAGKAFGDFFASQISGQKSFNQASEALFKQGASAAIDALVQQKLAEVGVVQVTEIGKALIKAPLSFGAELAKIPLILAAGAAAKAAVGQIKFHEGGIVGGSIDAPPRDVPIIAQAGERVLSREETQAQAGGGGQPIVIENIITLDSDELQRFVTEVNPNADNI